MCKRGRRNYTERKKKNTCWPEMVLQHLNRRVEGGRGEYTDMGAMKGKLGGEKLKNPCS